MQNGVSAKSNPPAAFEILVGASLRVGGGGAEAETQQCFVSLESF